MAKTKQKKHVIDDESMGDGSKRNSEAAQAMKDLDINKKEKENDEENAEGQEDQEEPKPQDENMRDEETKEESKLVDEEDENERESQMSRAPSQKEKKEKKERKRNGGNQPDENYEQQDSDQDEDLPADLMNESQQDDAKIIKVKEKSSAKKTIDEKKNVNQIENAVKCTIKEMDQFKTCLESVRFPTNQKNRFNDVVFQAMKNGILLKSAAYSGTIMTRAMIRKDFFYNDSYELEIRNPLHLEQLQNNDQQVQVKPLIEFCLPFSELKQLVDGMVEEDHLLEIEYPKGDNYLQIIIPEESRGASDKVKSDTTITLETYEAQHTLNADFNSQKLQTYAQIFGKVQHFKKALREFQFLPDKELIEVRFSESYPNLQFIYEKEEYARYHSVKFNSEVDDLIYKQTSEQSARYTVESLRLAFSRITKDNMLCIVSLNEEGSLSVKHMHEHKRMLIESLILPQEEMTNM